VGALVVLVREDSIQEYVIAGRPVMALFSGPLLGSIFNPHGPAHDGAVIMENGRLTEMGVVLPLSNRADVPERYGTRHRAALGLSERTDAVCLVVSEERGEVSTVVGGEITAWEGPEQLAAKLREYLGLTEVARPTVVGVLKGIFLDSWWVKIGAVAVMTLAWLILAGQQNYQVEVEVPVRYVRLAPDLVLSRVSPAQVKLAVTGRRHLAANLKPGEVRVRVDLADYGAGEQVIRLGAGNVILPVGLSVERIRPPDVRVVIQSRHAAGS
jgi:diadenylate cyclase